MSFGDDTLDPSDRPKFVIDDGISSLEIPGKLEIIHADCATGALGHEPASKCPLKGDTISPCQGCAMHISFVWQAADGERSSGLGCWCSFHAQMQFGTVPPCVAPCKKAGA